MSEEVPPSPENSIDGSGNVQDWPYPFDGRQDFSSENDFFGESIIEVYPQDNEDANKNYHPFELEFHVDEENEVELRCYFGILYFSIAAIQIEAFDDNDTSDANKRFGIKSQSKLPGIGNITPAGFISQDDGSNTKYCSLKRGTLGPNGEVPVNSFGTVYLRFFLDSANHKISEADINFVADADQLDPEEPCGELKRVGTDKLLREEPTKGMYYLKIGSFNPPQNSSVLITQMIEDNVYYSTTIIDNSEAPQNSDGAEYSTTTVPANPNTPESFGPATVDPPVSVETGDTGVVIQSPRPNPETGGGVTQNQPNDQENLPERGTLTTIVEEVVKIPAATTTGANFGGTGAAGTPATTDQDGYIPTGDIEGLTELHETQTESPTGSPGGSPSSTSFSN